MVFLELRKTDVFEQKTRTAVWDVPLTSPVGNTNFQMQRLPHFWELRNVHLENMRFATQPRKKAGASGAQNSEPRWASTPSRTPQSYHLFYSESAIGVCVCVSVLGYPPPPKEKEVKMVVFLLLFFV